MLSGKKILLGVTGGIAAYKSAALLRDFQKAGAEVRVVMTDAATRFVGRDTFSALSRTPVACSIFDDGADPDHWVRHVHWAEWADAFVIAPCTANTLGKIVNGLTDNMLTSMVAAARCPVAICPTMDGQMYHSPGIQRNLQIARDDSYHIIEPDEGYLASGLHDHGRLPANDEILHHLARVVNTDKLLSGKKVLISAGPTREHLDPVRYLSNPSSGKTGVSFARAADLNGAEVTLLLGPTSITPPPGIQVERFESSEELYQLVEKNWKDHDVLIMTAAVSDFRPASREDSKIKKDKSELSLSLKRTTDILKWAGSNRANHQTVIGFAMETENLEDQAKAKLENKNLDWIAGNVIDKGKSGFEIDHNELLLLGRNGERYEFDGGKTHIAEQVLAKIFS